MAAFSAERAFMLAKFILFLIAALFVMDAAQIIDIAEAAGGAFAVDTADVSEAGSCKLETWLSAASNTDMASVANPACVLDIFRPIEFSAQISHTRADSLWATSVAPKAKTNLVPTAIGSLGFAFAAGTSFDTITGENLTVFAVVPATLRLSETMRINLNGGWLWDRTVDRHYLTYGAAFDWKLTEIVTLTTEVFGQAGMADDPHIVQPRFQAGLRFRPIETFSLDVIYGRNIAGENSNWITVGTTIRFPPPAK